MPKRSIELFVLDILLFTNKIERYAVELDDPHDLLADEIREDAVLHTLGLIGEAMNHVVKSKKLRDFIKPSWRKIVDFRNIVIHEYFGVSGQEVFRIVKVHVPILEKEIIELIKRAKDELDFDQAMQDIRQELKALKRKESLAYITKIERRLKK